MGTRHRDYSQKGVMHNIWGSVMRLRIKYIAMRLSRVWGVAFALMPFALAALAYQPGEDAAKPRVVITADPELDDNNTIIRAILYSSDVKFEGLVYVSSQFHWTDDGKGTTQYIAGREYTRMGLCPCTSWRFSPDERFIDNIVDAYAKIYGNLRAHDPDYPSPEELKSKIKWGNVDFDGDFSKDTDGSNLIKSLLLDDLAGPVYVTAQGGESTIARALKSIYDQYAKTPQWEATRDKVSQKLIIIPSGDQDGTDAAYIRPNWPEVREYEFSGINFGYGAQDRASDEGKIYFSPGWTEEHISNRGPLGALYRVWGDGKQMVKGDRTDYFGLSGYSIEQLKAMGYMVWMHPEPKGAFLGEGDTPTFLNLIDNGLRAYENPPGADGPGGCILEACTIRSSVHRRRLCRRTPRALPADWRPLEAMRTRSLRRKPARLIYQTSIYLPYRRAQRPLLPASLQRHRTTSRYGCCGP
jgi:hypothetical protein